MNVINGDANGKVNVFLIVLLTILVLVLSVVVGVAFLAAPVTGKVLNYNLTEPLGFATTAKIDINPGDGNLTIDSITGSDQVLASGTLQYLEKQGLPTQSLNISSGLATLTLKAGGTAQWNRLPWEACNGATEWQVHLNPTVQTELTAYSDGGNVNLNLAGMSITHASAETGGGNMDVVLPDNAANINVNAKTGAGNVHVEIGSGISGSNIINATSGAGNVAVLLPGGVAVRIHVVSGMGKVIVDPSINMVDKNTYQSSDFDNAADRIEIYLNSGAGNVTVNTK